MANDVEKFPDVISNAATPVRVITHIQDDDCLEGTVDGTATIETILSITLDPDVVEIEILPIDGALVYNPKGAAVAGTNGRIPSGAPILVTGNTAKLNLAQFAKSTDPVIVTIILRKLITG